MAFFKIDILLSQIWSRAGKAMLCKFIEWTNNWSCISSIVRHPDIYARMLNICILKTKQYTNSINKNKIVKSYTRPKSTSLPFSKPFTVEWTLWQIRKDLELHVLQIL